jgi:hypothetical protein
VSENCVRSDLGEEIYDLYTAGERGEGVGGCRLKKPVGDGPQVLNRVGWEPPLNERGGPNITVGSREV